LWDYSNIPGEFRGFPCRLFKLREVAIIGNIQGLLAIYSGLHAGGLAELAVQTLDDGGLL